MFLLWIRFKKFVRKNLNRVTGAGLLVALGIIYGDIGTSPLYVIKAHYLR